MSTPNSTLDLNRPADAAYGRVRDRVANRDPLFADITQFLTDEAALLDDNRLGDWLRLMADDIIYVAPLRRTVIRRQGSGFDETMGHFDDDADSLAFSRPPVPRQRERLRR